LGAGDLSLTDSQPQLAVFFWIHSGTVSWLLGWCMIHACPLHIIVTCQHALVQILALSVSLHY
jgi:hypothetical protein